MRKMIVNGENAISGKRDSILFILLTYLISWVSWGALVLLGIPAKSGALSTMLYLLGGLSPTIAAFALPLHFGRAARGIKGTSHSKPRSGITCSPSRQLC